MFRSKQVDLCEALNGSVLKSLLPIRTAAQKLTPMRSKIEHFLALLALSFGLAATLPKSAQATDAYFVQRQCQSKGVYSVSATIQVEGTLKPSADAKIAQMPITVQGSFAYDEMRLNGGKADRRSVRYYREAAATIQVDKHIESPTLRDDLRLVIVQSDKNKVSISSLRGPLTREELDLIDLPGNTLLLDGLLPAEKAKIGDSWKMTDAALAQLVCVDVVSRNEVTCEFSGVNGSKAEIKIAGRLNAAVGGVATEIHLDGTAALDIATNCLTSLQLRIKERRSVGYVAPGMDVTAQLNIAIAPLASSEQLTPAIAKEAAATDAQSHPLALRSNAGGFHLVYDRRWHITRNEMQLVVLRLVDRGELIAQCNISPLPTLDKGKTVTIEQFQSEVAQSLGKKFDHFETAAEGKGAGGLRVLKVVAAGVVSEIPIQWRYYLAVDPDGRRLAMAYTMESDLVERFADADAAMTESIEFDTATPTAATEPVASDPTAKK